MTGKEQVIKRKQKNVRYVEMNKTSKEEQERETREKRMKSES